MTGTEVTTMAPRLTSIEMSRSLALGCPNLPAVKKVTDVPLVGTLRVREFERAPVVPVRNTTAPPPAADLPEMVRLTEGPVVPEGSVIRTRHGDGAQDRYLALALELLFTCKSTFT